MTESLLKCPSRQDTMETSALIKKVVLKEEITWTRVGINTACPKKKVGKEEECNSEDGCLVRGTNSPENHVALVPVLFLWPRLLVSLVPHFNCFFTIFFPSHHEENSVRDQALGNNSRTKWKIAALPWLSLQPTCSICPYLLQKIIKSSFIWEEVRKGSTVTGQMTQLVSWHSDTLCYTIQILLSQN